MGRGRILTEPPPAASGSHCVAHPVLTELQPCPTPPSTSRAELLLFPVSPGLPPGPSGSGDFVQVLGEPSWHREESGGSAWCCSGNPCRTRHGSGSIDAGLGPGTRHGTDQGLQEVAPQESRPCPSEAAASVGTQDHHRCHSPGSQTGDAWRPIGPEAARVGAPRQS